MDSKIIQKLKESKITGRSGSGFPVGLKWEIVKKAKGKKYVICNGAEGEPNTFKDKFILKNYPEEVINGINLAIGAVGAESAYFYINKNYYRELGDNLKKIAKNSKIKFFEKSVDRYIAGEETSIIEAIEGKEPEPRVKPPFPTSFGLFGCPTLINNVETFYFVSKISKGQYNNEKFYCISGAVRNEGVFKLQEKMTIKEILVKTENMPDFDFFLQVGGGAVGEVILPKEINKPLAGLGSIIIFNKEKTDPYLLMEKWVNFLLKGNCDKCVPCREGLYRIAEIIGKKEIKEKELNDLFFVLKETSLCPLGKSAFIPFLSLIKKIMK